MTCKGRRKDPIGLFRIFGQTTTPAGHEGEHEENQEDDERDVEQRFRDRGGCRRNAGEAEKAGDQRDNRRR